MEYLRYSLALRLWRIAGRLDNWASKLLVHCNVSFCDPACNDDHCDYCGTFCSKCGAMSTFPPLQRDQEITP